MDSKLSISAINNLDWNSFIATFGNVVEGSPDCAAAVYFKKPFLSFDNFVAAMTQFLDDLPKDGKLGILRNFKEQADSWDVLSSESQREQLHTGIRFLSVEEGQQLEDHKQLYREKFGFPFVICSRLTNKDAILEQIRRRLDNDDDEEVECAMEEVKNITLLRMKDLVSTYEQSKL